nr:TonB-dependent receptor [Sandaracinobacter neustonicus]
MAGVATALLVAAPVLAQEADILVLGRGLPAGPGVPAYGSVLIDAERLREAGRLETGLLDVAGFQQFRRSDSRSANPSAQGATLRALGGNAASRTLVTLDGVPVADPFFGHIPFTALSPERLGAVRVTRGGGSGAFAAGAVAGTIELMSATLGQLPDLAAQAEGGSHGSTGVQAGLTADLGGGYVSLSGRWDRSDGFWTTPKDQRVPASARAANEGWSLSGRAVVPLGAAELQARVLLFRDERTLRFKGADSGSEGQDASLRLIARGPWEVEALAYVQARNFRNIVISSTTFRPTLDQRNTPATGLGGKLELRPPMGGDQLLRLGADLRWADGTMFETAFNGSTGAITARRQAGGQQLSAGLFAEDDWTLGELVLTGGARLDHWAIRDGHYESHNAAGVPTQSEQFANRQDWRLSGRAGLLWHATGALSLRAAAYSNHRLPTLNELYRPFVVFPVTTQANAALKPEVLQGIEAGVEFQPLPTMRLALTAFDNRLKDAIANVTIAPNLRQRRNVEAIHARGLEATGTLAFGAFDLSGSLALTHSRVRADGTAMDGLRPAQTPELMLSATAGWRPAEGTTLSATLRHTGRQYEDDLQTDSLPAATTLDLFGQLPLTTGVSLYARAENLFDANVFTRNVGGSLDLGTPRTLWVGLRVEALGR